MIEEQLAVEGDTVLSNFTQVLRLQKQHEPGPGPNHVAEVHLVLISR